MVYLLKKYITKTQTVQPKNWTIWYSIISTIIILQFVLFNWMNIKTSFLNNYWFLFSTFLVTTFWIFVKHILEKNNSYKKEIQELNHFKRNFNFFQFHCKSIEEYDGFESLKGIQFGNKNTTTQFTLIINPESETCRNDFKEAYELFLNLSDKIQINILFNTHSKNSKANFAATILALNEQNPERAKNALFDWFINNLNTENWLQKWHIETPHLLNNNELDNQHYWCTKNEFYNQSVKIINGNLFPEEYQITDLKYFIKDFQEEFEWENTLKAV